MQPVSDSATIHAHAKRLAPSGTSETAHFGVRTNPASAQ